MLHGETHCQTGPTWRTAAPGRKRVQGPATRYRSIHVFGVPGVDVKWSLQVFIDVGRRLVTVAGKNITGKQIELTAELPDELQRCLDKLS